MSISILLLLLPALIPALGTAFEPPVTRPLLDVTTSVRTLRTRVSARSPGYGGKSTLMESAPLATGEWVRDHDVDLVDGKGQAVGRAMSYVESVVGGTSITFVLDAQAMLAGQHEEVTTSSEGAHRTVFELTRPAVLAARAHVENLFEGGAGSIGLTGPAGPVFKIETRTPGPLPVLVERFELPVGRYVLEAEMDLEVQLRKGVGDMRSINVEAELVFTSGG